MCVSQGLVALEVRRPDKIRKHSCGSCTLVLWMCLQGMSSSSELDGTVHDTRIMWVNALKTNCTWRYKTHS